MTRVLLVDDHPMIGAALEMLLRGQRLSSCSAAPAALPRPNGSRQAEARPRCCSTSTCPTVRGSTFCGGCARRARART